MTLDLIYTLALGTSLLAYLALCLFCVVTIPRKITGKALLGAAILTLFYLSTLALSGESLLTFSLKFMALTAWIVLVCRGVGISSDNLRLPAMRPVVVLLTATAALLATGLLQTFWLLPRAAADNGSPLIPSYAIELLLSICGLVALEQLVRNAREDLRWRLRYLNLGVGLIFVFTTLHGALALLFGGRLPVLSSLQPAVFALAVPFVAIASLRNRDNELRLNVSREFAFRTGVLFTVGTALLLFGLAGYYAKLFGGDVATALIVLLATVFVLGGFVVFGSSRVQSRLRRSVAENLFARKHDYRSVWGRVSAQLTEPSADFTLPQQSIRGFLSLLDTNGGALWRLSESKALVPYAQMHTTWEQPLSRRLSSTLCEFFGEKEWIVDLLAPPAMLRAEAAPELRERFPGMRFLVPLMTQGELFGIVATTEPRTPTKLIWEDYDVLRLVSRQTAGVLALEHAGHMLRDTQQLNTFNRVSAFVVHDLKTITAQLKLLLDNAQQHKTNPAFVDDMLRTVSNTTERMDRLLAQFRNQVQRRGRSLDLKDLVTEALAQFEAREPQPRLCNDPVGAVRVNADPTKLSAVIGHTVENAIEATPADGHVHVAVLAEDNWAEITVEDSGCGMPQDFLEQKLFVPFESTKGVTGMGIGAYQTREYIRSLGGDVEVNSSPETGTRFVLRIPLEAA